MPGAGCAASAWGALAGRGGSSGAGTGGSACTGAATDSAATGGSGGIAGPGFVGRKARTSKAAATALAPLDRTSAPVGGRRWRESSARASGQAGSNFRAAWRCARASACLPRRQSSAPSRALGSGHAVSSSAARRSAASAREERDPSGSGVEDKASPSRNWSTALPWTRGSWSARSASAKCRWSSSCFTSRSIAADGESRGGSDERTCSSTSASRVPRFATPCSLETRSTASFWRAFLSACSSARSASSATTGRLSGLASGATAVSGDWGSRGSHTGVNTGCGSVAVGAVSGAPSGAAARSNSIFASFCAGGSGVLAATAARISRSSSRLGRCWMRSMARAMSASVLYRC